MTTTATFAAAANNVNTMLSGIIHSIEIDNNFENSATKGSSMKF